MSNLGMTEEAYLYDAGEVCQNPSGMPFGFNSLLRSRRTGLVYMRNRGYSPRLGQFVSHDPVGYVDSYHPYAFVAFDPINGWDPWGLRNRSLAPEDLDDETGWNPLYTLGTRYWLAFEADQKPETAGTNGV